MEKKGFIFFNFLPSSYLMPVATVQSLSLSLSLVLYDRLSSNSCGSVLLMQERPSGEQRHMFMTHDVRHKVKVVETHSLLAKFDITKA